MLLHEAKVVRDIFHAFVHEQKSISGARADGNPHRLYVYAFPGYGHYLSASDGQLTIWAEAPQIMGRVDW